MLRKKEYILIIIPKNLQFITYLSSSISLSVLNKYSHNFWIICPRIKTFCKHKLARIKRNIFTIPHKLLPRGLRTVGIAANGANIV